MPVSGGYGRRKVDLKREKHNFPNKQLCNHEREIPKEWLKLS